MAIGRETSTSIVGVPQAGGNRDHNEHADHVPSIRCSGVLSRSGACNK